jgi:alpha-beta hydrolase superfamily lysophospholipase
MFPSSCLNRLARLLVALFSLVPMVAFAAPPPQPPSAFWPPQLAAAHFVASDGSVLPVRRWLPDRDPPQAAVVALHGFNDYSRAFEMPGAFFQSHGVACYAYDQRGFGQAPGHGTWPGIASYVDDLTQFTAAVRQRHPGIPVYVLGESMGAAVAIVAMTSKRRPAADGLILSAPAVWSRDTMPWYQRALLETSVRTMPWLRVTGDGLGFMPSDNIEVLRGLGRDPQVIKATRIDAIYGLVDLMDEAMARVDRIDLPTLLLIGDRDEIIPKEPMQRLLERLPRRHATRVATYADGYHLLLRDLQAEKPWRDIVAWIGDRDRPLPSGAEQRLALAPSRDAPH